MRPGRRLAPVTGWYLRALAINGVQMAITWVSIRFWNQALTGFSLAGLHRLHAPALEGSLAWFVGTFFFYFWHRLRH